MSRIRLATALVLSTGVLVACGTGDDSPASPAPRSSASTAEPATGPEIPADDFTFNAPVGWKANDGSNVPSINFLALAVATDDTDGFSDNVNVISDPTLTRVDNVDDLGKAVEKVLTGVAKDVEILDPVTVDGDGAAVASATFNQGDISYRTRQYAVTHDDRGYIVTFSYSKDVPEAEQRSIADSVMASWSWAS